MKLPLVVCCGVNAGKNTGCLYVTTFNLQICHYLHTNKYVLTTGARKIAVYLKVIIFSGYSGNSLLQPPMGHTFLAVI